MSGDCPCHTPDIRISPDLHALLWCEIEFPVSHVEESVPVVEECHDDIDAVLGD